MIETRGPLAHERAELADAFHERREALRRLARYEEYLEPDDTDEEWEEEAE